LVAKAEPVAQYFIMELAVLTVLIVSLAISLYALRKAGGPEFSATRTPHVDERGE
jgi:hypothetical protein